MLFPSALFFDLRRRKEGEEPACEISSILVSHLAEDQKDLLSYSGSSVLGARLRDWGTGSVGRRSLSCSLAAAVTAATASQERPLFESPRKSRVSNESSVRSRSTRRISVARTWRDVRATVARATGVSCTPSCRTFPRSIKFQTVKENVDGTRFEHLPGIKRRCESVETSFLAIFRILDSRRETRTNETISRKI